MARWSHREFWQSGTVVPTVICDIVDARLHRQFEQTTFDLDPPIPSPVNLIAASVLPGRLVVRYFDFQKPGFLEKPVI